MQLQNGPNSLSDGAKVGPEALCLLFTSWQEMFFTFQTSHLISKPQNLRPERSFATDHQRGWRGGQNNNNILKIAWQDNMGSDGLDSPQKMKLVSCRPHIMKYFLYRVVWYLVDYLLWRLERADALAHLLPTWIIGTCYFSVNKC